MRRPSEQELNQLKDAIRNRSGELSISDVARMRYSGGTMTLVQVGTVQIRDDRITKKQSCDYEVVKRVLVNHVDQYTIYDVYVDCNC